MKHFKIIFVLILIFCKINSYSQWVAQAALPGTLYGVYLVNENMGYVCGTAYDGGIIYKTTNGGVNWNLVLHDTIVSCFSDLFFTSPDTGYVVGQNGIIIKTTNGGIDWVQQNSTSNFTLWTIKCPAKDTCYTSGRGVFKTVNGGVTWQSVYNDGTFINSLDFINSKYGYIVGQKTMKTTDGGNSWLFLNNQNYWDVSFSDENTGFGIYSDSIMKTIDGGFTWNTILNLNLSSSVVFMAVQALNQNNVFIACSTSVGLRVLKTYNSGNTWYSQEQNSDNGGAQNIFLTDTSNGWIVCMPLQITNNIYRTSNAGGNGIQLIVPEIDNKNFKIYPNPVSEILNFVVFGEALIELYDTKGQLLFKHKFTGEKFIYDISNYGIGIYIAKITGDKSTKIEKIIKY